MAVETCMDDASPVPPTVTISEGWQSPSTETGTALYPAWGRFCAARERPPFVAEACWSTWIAGESRPPLTSVTWAAACFMTTEDRILSAAGYPGNITADAAMDLRALSNQLRYKQTARLKYLAQKTWRASTGIIPIKAKLWSSPQPEAPFTAHCKMLAAMPPNERSAHKARLRSANKKLHRERRREARAGRPKSIGWIRQQLAEMNARLSRLEGRLDETRVRPWMWDNCWSLKEWKSKHHEKAREYQLAAWKENTYRRQEYIANMAGTFTRAEWIERMREFGYRCAYCGMHRREQRKRYGTDIEADHVIALSSGGGSLIADVVPACKGCNSSKSTKDLMQWAAAKGLTPHPIAIAAYESRKALCRNDLGPS